MSSLHTESGELVEIDVKSLEPPEPMTQILKALAQLSPNQILRVYHRREPFPLYEKLNEAGWRYHSQKLADDLFAIHIFKPENHQRFTQHYEHIV